MDSPHLSAIEEHLPHLTEAEILHLMGRLNALAQAKAATEPKVRDINKYRGTIKHGPDPLEFQEAIRAEWDRPWDRE